LGQEADSNDRRPLATAIRWSEVVSVMFSLSACSALLIKPNEPFQSFSFLSSQARVRLDLRMGDLSAPQSAPRQCGPQTKAAAMLKTVQQTILVITCILVVVGFAPNTKVHETDDGLVAPTAVCATARSSVATSRGKIAPSAPTCNGNRLAEGVLPSTAPARIVSRTHFGTPDHRLKLFCLLRC
jgi:hypothetical protein